MWWAVIISGFLFAVFVAVHNVVNDESRDADRPQEGGDGFENPVGLSIEHQRTQARNEEHGQKGYAYVVLAELLHAVPLKKSWRKYAAARIKVLLLNGELWARHVASPCRGEESEPLPRP